MIRPITPIVPGFDLPLTTYAENQPEYNPLPAWRGEDGMVVTRWQFGWKDRLLVLVGGSVWLSQLTFHRRLQPVKLTSTCPIQGHTGHDPEIG